MTIYKIFFSIMIVAAAVEVAAATDTDAAAYTRFLIPIHVPHGVTGADGAVWTTEVVAANTSPKEVILGPCAPGFPEDAHSPCPPMYYALPPLSVAVRESLGWTAAGPLGRFVWVRSEDGSGLQFDLAVARNGNRVAKIPVVGESAFAADTLYLMNVTAEPGARTLLRIYGYDNADDTVRIQLLSLGEHTPRSEFDVQLVQSPFVDPSGLPYAPSYAQVTLDAGLFRIGERVVVALKPQRQGARIWAFATATSTDGRSVSVTLPFRP